MPAKRHFLVVAAASRGARLFIKKALQQGHDVTALCRARDNRAALERITKLVQDSKLTPDNTPISYLQGELRAFNLSILEPITYTTLLKDDVSIDAVCCFVGVTKMKDMFNKDHRLYTRTVNAIVEGMRQSRWVEFFYHGSSGSEGPPGQNIPQLPENYVAKWLLAPFLRMPAVKDYLDSEGVLARSVDEGMCFVIFRPAFLTNGRAKRKYGYSFDTTGLNKEELPLKNTTMSISREDVAEEMLRVATLSKQERAQWYGHGVYLADFKKNVQVKQG